MARPADKRTKQPCSSGATERKSQTPRYNCSICGKPTAGRVPRGGDGTFILPRRHNGPDGQPCRGNIEEVVWPEEL